MVLSQTSLRVAYSNIRHNIRQIMIPLRTHTLYLPFVTKFLIVSENLGLMVFEMDLIESCDIAKVPINILVIKYTLEIDFTRMCVGLSCYPEAEPDLFYPSVLLLA